MTTSSPQRAVMVVLAYLWPLALIPLFAAKSDPDVQWHAKHGLTLAVAELALAVALWILIGVASLASLGLGCALGMLVVLAAVTILVVHLTAALRALAGGRLLVPWVSDYASRF